MAVEAIWPESTLHAFVEIDPFCQRWLRTNWPGCRIISDAKDYKHDGTAIDILTGGPPCQYFSSATHGRRVAEDLSGNMADICERVSPPWIIAENVSKASLKNIRRRIDNRYSTELFSLRADEVGADHKRNRWWLVAHSDHKGKLPSRIYAKMERKPLLSENPWTAENYARVLRVSNGFPHRNDLLRGFGNAIVPAVVIPILEAIKAIEKES